ncbi:hypothetical protein Y1Q_0022069 [Alligator mississippiensis]|uniref:Uncharacterized protein n=1 Tax=Alligator mississippiensis TaxID=8496 RepID=A0A151M5Z6_ALLMI|nr:hypothetical protein Y1Q_0022069 [Alligator mississippiensis]
MPENSRDISAKPRKKFLSYRLPRIQSLHLFNLVCKMMGPVMESLYQPVETGRMMQTMAQKTITPKGQVDYCITLLMEIIPFCHHAALSSAKARGLI